MYGWNISQSLSVSAIAARSSTRVNWRSQLWCTKAIEIYNGYWESRSTCSTSRRCLVGLLPDFAAATAAAVSAFSPAKVSGSSLLYIILLMECRGSKKLLLPHCVWTFVSSAALRLELVRFLARFEETWTLGRGRARWHGLHDGTDYAMASSFLIPDWQTVTRFNRELMVRIVLGVKIRVEKSGYSAHLDCGPVGKEL